jgi:hypothetical protein
MRLCLTRTPMIEEHMAALSTLHFFPPLRYSVQNTYILDPYPYVPLGVTVVCSLGIFGR